MLFEKQKKVKNKSFNNCTGDKALKQCVNKNKAKTKK